MRFRGHLRWLATFALALVAFVTSCTDVVRRSSLVPAPNPAPPPGFGSAQSLTAGGSVTSTSRAHEAGAQGLWIPRGQVHASLGLRPLPLYQVRFLYRTVVHRGAAALGRDGRPAPRRAGHFFGAGHGWRISERGWPGALDIDIQIGGVDVPSRACDRRNLEECVAEDYEAEDQIALRFAGGLIGNWWPITDVRLLARLTLTSRVAHGDDGGLWLAREPMLLASVGAEWRVHGRFSLIGQAHVPVTPWPVRHGPIVGVALRAWLTPDPRRGQWTPSEPR